MPTSGIVITNTFNSESGFVPASQLDTNFGQCVTALNTLQTFGNYYVDTGSANAMAITVASPLIVAYTAGLPLQVKVAAANVDSGGTGATTINVSGLGTRNVTYPSTGALYPGQLAANAIISLMYDGTQFQYLGPIFGSGSFTATLTGCTTSPTGTLYWTINGQVAYYEIPSLSATSNSVAMTMTTLPAYLQTTRQQNVAVPDQYCRDNGTNVGGANSSGASVQISNGSNAIAFFKNGSINGWTGSGTKGTTSTFTVSANLK